MAGVTSNGFVSRSRDEIVERLNNRMIGTFGEQFDVSPESPDGQFIGIIADEMATLWQMGADAFNAYNPDRQSDIPLDNACRINDVRRIVNSPTRVGADLSGVAGTFVPKGSRAKTADDITFVTENDVVIPGSTTMTCETPGVIKIIPNELNIIVSEISGWTGVTNPEAGVTGVIRESNTSLRARREREVVRTGKDSADAIRSAVSELGVEKVIVIDNDTANVVDGIPPGQFETVVDGGILSEIAQKILEAKSIGVPAFGQIPVNITDSQGIPKTIGVSRPTDVPLELEITLEAGPKSPNDAGDMVKNSMLEYFDKFSMGDKVTWSKLFAPANTVIDTECANIRIRRVGGAWQEATINVQIREKVSLAIENITVLGV